MARSLIEIGVLGGLVATAAIMAPVYLRHFRIDRPPIGVYNLGDVLIIGMTIVLVPPLLVHLPSGVVGTIFALVALMILTYTLAPVISSRRAFAVAAVAVAIDVALAIGSGYESLAFQIFNDVLVIVLVVGVTNLYVQSGMNARDVAIFAGGLAIYDAIATAWLPTMVEFFSKVIELPVAPNIASGLGEDVGALGLGDLLVIVLWTVTCEKAFGRTEAIVAGVTGVLSVALVRFTFWFEVAEVLPAMVLHGPIIVVQYHLFSRAHGRERTIGEYYAGMSPAVSHKRTGVVSDIASAH